MEFTYLVFIHMLGGSYRKRLRSLLLYLCYVFRALINSPVWYIDSRNLRVKLWWRLLHITKNRMIHAWWQTCGGKLVEIFSQSGREKDGHLITKSGSILWSRNKI